MKIAETLKIRMLRINTSGFTLVEILIAVAIFSVIMLTLFSSLRIFLTSAHIIKQEVDQIEKTTSSFKQITTDLKMIFITHPPMYSKPDFDSEPDQYRFEGEGSELSFASLCHVKYNNDSIDSIVRIVYYLRAGKNYNIFDLCRKQMLQPYSNVEKSCTDPVLVTDVSNVKVTYIDHNGETHDSWDSESSEFEYKFPAAVNFVITFYNGNEEEEDKERKVETSISLPVKRIFMQ
ncbi:MAG: prepilin-type N-terminal cleavage/methylation domain-containing protein [Desulfobacteraceae bacterium]|nr:prepilin-type N-terminal cleavage/methylation domain-containing protein [Desulfobacteraceae bacterium]